MKKGIIQFIVGLIILAGCIFIENELYRDLFIKIGIGYLIATLIEVLTYVWDEWNKISLILQAYGLKQNKPIRISMAYLFRIQAQGKFLLVKNHRDQPGYQPVGGVYKYLREENQQLFAELGIEPCHFMPVDKQSRNDLRKIILHRKNLIPFLKWFDSKKNRETDPWREFQEELIADGIVSSEAFPYIQYNLCYSKRTGIQRSQKFNTDELLHADVYDLKWCNSQQSDAFENLLNKPNERYVFATPEEIQKGYTNDGKVILSHSKKLFNK
jgi:hypothetical protein